jgi:hypothetical protein
MGFEPIPYYLGGITHNDGIRWNITGYHRFETNNGTIANCDTVQYCSFSANPAVASYDNIAFAETPILATETKRSDSTVLVVSTHQERHTT